MIKFIKKYRWCKRMGINHPIRAALDKTFCEECFEELRFLFIVRRITSNSVQKRY